MTHFVVVVLQWPDVEEGALTVASDGAILSGIWVKHCDVGDDVVDVRVLTNPRAVEVQIACNTISCRIDNISLFLNSQNVVLYR